MDKIILEGRKRVWEQALMLSGYDSLEESAISELSEYFHKDKMEIREVLSQAEKLFAEEWQRMEINREDSESVTSFYNNSQYEILELMDWHVNRFNEGPLNYVCAMEIAKKEKFTRYLDYGSGIGSGSILFLKNGFEVFSADVATPLQEFIKFRLKKRNIEACFIDLKKEKLENAIYDIVTCFDVLEHSVKPMKILEQLGRALRVGGFLILNNVECKLEEKRPMHISEVCLEQKLRYLGFDQLWDLQEDFKKSNPNYVIVLKKVNRSIFVNMLFFIYDNFCPLSLKRLLNRKKSC